MTMQLVYAITLGATVTLGLLGAWQSGKAAGRVEERKAWGLPMGDGKADDTQAIQRLLSGGTVALPPGEYMLKDGLGGIRIPSNADLTARPK